MIIAVQSVLALKALARVTIEERIGSNESQTNVLGS